MQDLHPPTTAAPTVNTFENDCNFSIRLASRTMLSHLVNHLFHFPMGAGAASLSSMIHENDDVKENGVTSEAENNVEELTMEVFKAPNIQFFLLNENTVLTLVELPVTNHRRNARPNPYTSGLKTAQSQVRIILRDISGKFCWDSSALFGLDNLSDVLNSNRRKLSDAHAQSSHLKTNKGRGEYSNCQKLLHGKIWDASGDNHKRIRYTRTVKLNL